MVLCVGSSNSRPVISLKVRTSAKYNEVQLEVECVALGHLPVVRDDGHIHTHTYTHNAVEIKCVVI